MAEKDPKSFLKIERKKTEYRNVDERKQDYQEVFKHRSVEDSREQASRCMDCGTPFCSSKCPLGNIIPEWNEYIRNGQWKEAFELLSATNNLPEMTGRVCPAPCEYGCVLGLGDDPITIRENELAIVEYAFENGIAKAKPPKERTGKKAAVVGSGPAGLAAAAQLNQAGHSVTVFEKYKNPGGLLRYGIPDFKLDKKVVERRLNLYKDEGIEFKTEINVGKDITAEQLKKDFDAVVITTGSRVPRDLNIDGRYLKGIHFAMDFLTQTNKIVSNELSWETIDNPINAEGKDVVVIGGGDTGSDCIGTSNRQGANSVTQLEVMPMPPKARTEDFPWPQYPMLLKTTTSHEEGADRQWSVLTKEFVGTEAIEKIKCVKVEFIKPEGGGRPIMQEVEGSEFEIKADLVVLAIGFLHNEHDDFLSELGVDFDKRGNINTDESQMTDAKGIFAAGDCRTGQSLVVRAMTDARRAAHYVDKYLMGSSVLPLP